jgi:rod shape determining protein RodA
MDIRDVIRRIDWVLMVTVLCLLAYGVAIIYFGTKDDGLGAWYWAERQLVFVAIGLLAVTVVTAIDYDRFRRWYWPLWVFTVISIAIVYVLGPITRGSKRWIPLGFINLQPSELAIILLCVGLSALLVSRLDSLGSTRLTLLGLAYVAVPAAMVFLQPDLGTATVIMAMGLGVLFFFGTRWTHFAVLAGSVAAALVMVLAVLPALGVHLLKDYQIARLTVFLHPGADPSGAGYNVHQAMIAVGAGGLTGRGSLATQTQLAFLPEHHTDFIFAVAGERWGFVGVVILLVLYALLIWRALRTATLARDMYGSIMAGGIATVFLYQVLVNTGMTLGIMPVTGIPLPFISYGGAALLTNLLLIGLLQSIHLRGAEAQVMRTKIRLG